MMRRTILRSFILAAAVLATVTLSSCNADCPTCQSLRDAPPVQQLGFDLCVSKTPDLDPEPGAERCAVLTIQFAEVSE